ncbi:hypothetical protein B7463_g5240, partial [Scytalidium lignicola]
MGSRTVHNQNVSQRIVFAARKTCPLDQADNVACYASPQSTLSRYVHGPETDKIQDQEKPSYLKFREHYIDTGLIMGEVGAVKQLFEKALEIIKSNPQATDLTVFAQIFGEQEYHREVLRDLYTTPLGRLFAQFRWFLGFEQPGLLETHPTHQRVQPIEGVPLEFGIGLDYEGMLAQSTLTVKVDSAWLRYNDTKHISDVKTKLQANGKPKAIQSDIMQSLPPFWSPNGAKEDGFPQDLDWGNVPLYTNLDTGIVPAAIRLDSSTERAKNVLQSGWTSMWYHPEARRLMDLYVNEPYKAFAVLKHGSEEMAWWSRYEQKWATARRQGQPDKDWVPWKDMCEGFDEELFKDGKGLWKPPRNDY